MYGQKESGVLETCTVMDKDLVTEVRIKEVKEELSS